MQTIIPTSGNLKRSNGFRQPLQFREKTMKLSPYNKTKSAAKIFVAALKNHRWKAVVASVLILLFSVVFVWRIRERVYSTLANEKDKPAKSGLIPYQRNTRLPLSSKSIKHISKINGTRGVARFGDAYYMATEGGLVVTTLSGKLQRTYTTIDGLTENDLTAIKVFKSKIFIGTRTGYLLTFDGKEIESYLLKDRDVQTINALIEDNNRLLIGTFAGGLIEFDGKDFREIKGGVEQKRIAGITRIENENSKLYICTYADGLWIEDAGRWSHYTKANGLPSDRITGIVADNNLIVATDFGLVSANGNLQGAQTSTNLFHLIATLPTLSAVVSFDSRILFSTDDGKLFEIAADKTQRSQQREIEWNREQNLSGCKFEKVNDELLLLLSNEGIRQIQSQNQRLLIKPFLQTVEIKSLTDNSISAMAFDNEGRLWTGTFRNGLDVFDSKGQRIIHIETEGVREINSIVADKTDSAMFVSTSQGVFRFDNSFRHAQLTKSNGLLSNSVQHLAVSNQNQKQTTLSLATSRGFSFGTKDKFRSLTTVQGLPNNNTYTVLTVGNTTYLGTLGGLARIENGKVIRVFKDSNSMLKQNWVTALANIGDKFFIGTYSGGVFEMDSAGNIQGFENETGKITVNPNAILTTNQKLFVGTLNGVWIFDLRSQKWRHIQDELPSQTVLSIACDEQFIYFGTTSGIAQIEKKYFEEKGQNRLR